MPRTARTATAVVTATVLSVLAAGPAAAAPVAPGFATAEAAAITPGVELLTPLTRREAAACTAAFVFTGAGATYLGYAAHCAAEDADPRRSGCAEDPLPLGSPVTIVGRDGSRTKGQLAYSSWRTMQDQHETDATLCDFNDFALVQVDPGAVGLVNPTVPQLAGPTGIDTDGTQPGEPVYSYQPNNPGRALKEGHSLGDTGGGLAHSVQTSPPGNPGDSGSGYLDGDGKAIGVLSTQFVDGATDSPAANGVTDLAHALAYANRYSGLGPIALVRGDRPVTA